jgi:pantoate--beta-alanine ligase
MRTVRSIKQMQKAARELIAGGRTIGLVPTMGYLHEGHLSLIRRARKEADTVVVSIFVNPTQFAPGEDLERYPRDEKGDLRKIRDAGGDIVFMPKATDMYPDDFQTYVTVEEMTKRLEGESRPTHFRGVTTVVAKLFNIIRPDVAVFGMKDYQQAMVLKRMVRDLNFPLKIIIAPTVREEDGLAMSSRNAYFTPEQRAEAAALYRGLQSGRAMARAAERDAGKLLREIEAAIKATCPSAEIEYIAFTDLNTLEPVKKVDNHTVCSMAVRVHGVRLIDNMKLL